MSLDFETQDSYSVRVNVDDTTVGSSPDAFADFTLTVLDLVDPGTAGDDTFDVFYKGDGTNQWSVNSMAIPSSMVCLQTQQRSFRFKVAWVMTLSISTAEQPRTFPTAKRTDRRQRLQDERPRD